MKSLGRRIRALAGLLLLLPFAALSQWQFNGRVLEASIPASGVPSVPYGYLMPEPSSWPFLETTEAPESFQFALPDPEGRWTIYQFFRESVMASPLAEKYPHIQSFRGVDPGHPHRSVRMEWTELGLTASVRDPQRTYTLAPMEEYPQWYWIYERDPSRSSQSGTGRQCLDASFHSDGFLSSDPKGAATPSWTGSASQGLGEQRKTYRLALAANSEYAHAVSGGMPTKAAVLSAMVISVNRINEVLERELSVRLELIPQTEDLIYLFEPDPYGNTNPFQISAQNQANLDLVVGTANYDIGHVFTTGSGGVAEIASVCHPMTKGMATTGQPHPLGDRFDIDFVAHEIGHQLGATHSFNANYAGSCYGNAFWMAAYEPGSGSSIMSYAGICGPDNDVAPFSEDYFHRVSLLQIRDFLDDPLKGGQCGTSIPGPALPEHSGWGGHYRIPAGTPFELEIDHPKPGVLYLWEQWNLGEFGIHFSLASRGPLFRSFPPDTTGKRVFPRLENLRKGPPYMGEKLPDSAQEMVFRLTTRTLDQGWGQFHTSADSLRLEVIETAGPFLILEPGPHRDHWRSGDSVLIRWDRAGTQLPPISCEQVDLYLSLNGGRDFPILLGSGFPNQGEAWVKIPAGIYSSEARVKVKGHHQVFFAMSPRDFRIDPWPESLSPSPHSEDWRVFPNPGSEQLRFHATDRQPAHWRILNLQGQEVYRGIWPAQDKVETADWPPGVYLIEWIMNDSRPILRKKWMKL